ncbi:hypothetical protein [Natrinema marinum]|uniref:hypothetical protein n=1 Tax=Natrinema marinum TaxID=2961598 RepID=UPI0020C90C1A|nr:hypothetical protein [Natrinema marinum]
MGTSWGILLAAVLLVTGFLAALELAARYRELGFDSPGPLLVLLSSTLGVTVLYQARRLEKRDD